MAKFGIDEFSKIHEEMAQDAEDIGNLICKKCLDIFQEEINQYIHTLKGRQRKEILYKIIRISDSIAENFYLNILFNNSEKFGVDPRKIFLDGESLKEGIEKYCKENVKGEK